MIESKPHLDALNRTLPKEPTRMFKYRLDRNERNQPFSDAFIQRIKNKISGELFMVYPEMDPIYEKMAGWLKLNTNQLMLQSGSEQAIKTIFEAFINPGDKVLLHFPGFAMYAVYCNMFQAQIVGQHYDSELKFDWNAYREKITKDIRMVVVESPNGFLGLAPSLEDLELIVDKAHKLDIIALVDEAYFHFHDITAKDWINRFDNLIISRTFSKAFGLAGLRAGYLISNEENTNNLKKVRPAYELTSMTALVLSELLDNIHEVEIYLKETKDNRDALRQGLSELGIQSSDSKANFIAARLGAARIHDELRESLGKQNILIRRPFREEWLKEWVRISTAPYDIQNTLLNELRNIVTKQDV